MKSKLLHICAMVLVAQNLVEANDTENINGNAGKQPTERLSGQRQSTTVSSITETITSLKHEVAEIQEKLVASNIDDTILTKLQNGQKALSEFVHDVTSSVSVERDFSSLQKTTVKAQILLSSLKKGRLLSSENLEKQIAQLTEEHQTIVDKIANIDAARANHTETIATITADKGIIETTNTAITETKSRVQQLQKNIEDIQLYIAALKARKISQENLEKLRDLSNSLSEQFFNIQEVSLSKASSVSIAEIKKQLLKKADSKDLEKITDDLENTSEMMTGKAQMTVFQQNASERLNRIDSKLEEVDASVSSASEEGAKVVNKAASVTSQEVIPLKSSLAQQSDDILDLHEGIEKQQENGILSNDFLKFQEAIKTKLNAKTDSKTIANLQKHLARLQSIEDNIAENLSIIIDDIDKIEMQLIDVKDIKASDNDISMLTDICLLAQKSMLILKKDIQANYETLEITRQAFEELARAIEDLSVLIGSLHSIFQDHQFFGMGIIAKQERESKATLEYELSQSEIDLNLLLLELALLRPQFKGLKETLVTVSDTLNRKIRSNTQISNQILDTDTQISNTGEKSVSLQNELANIQHSLEEKEQELIKKKAEQNNLKKLLKVLNSSMNYDFINKTLSVLSHDMAMQNEIPDISAIDCTLVESGANANSESLKYTKINAASGLISCIKAGSLAIVSSGTGKLSIKTTIDGVENESEYVLSDISTTSIELFAPGTVSYIIDSGITIDKLILTIGKTISDVFRIPHNDIAIVSSIDANTKLLSSTASATVTDPKVTAIASETAIVKADSEHLKAKLTAIGSNSGIVMDLLSPNYGAFSYSIDVSSKIKGGIICEINDCVDINNDTPKTTSDGKLTYVKNCVKSEPIATEAGGVYFIEHDLGGSISFTEKGSIFINTIGVGTLEFVSGVTGTTIYDLSEPTTTIIAEDRLTANEVVYELVSANSENSVNLLRTTRIALLLDDISASISIPLTEPSVEVRSENSCDNILSVNVSEVITDSAIASAMTDKNERIDTLNSDKVTLLKIYDDLLIERNNLEEIRQVLQNINDNLMVDVSGYRRIYDVLSAEVYRLKNGGIEKDTENRNAKLRALGSENAFSMELVDRDYDSFSYNLEIRNLVKGQASQNTYAILPYTRADEFATTLAEKVTTDLSADENTGAVTYDLSKTMEDSEIAILAESKADAASEWIVKNSSVMANISTLTASNEAFTQQNNDLTEGNSILSMDNAKFTNENTSLTNDIAILEAKKSTTQTRLNADETKLSQIAKEIGFIPNLTLTDFVKDPYETLDYQLKVKNTIPHVSKVDPIMLTHEIVGVLWHQKKWSNILDASGYYVSGGTLTYPTKGTLIITTAGTGTMNFTSGLSEIVTKSYDNPSVPITFHEENLSDDLSISYTLSGNLLYTKSELTYPITTELEYKNDICGLTVTVTYKKNWNVILTNDDTTTITSTKDTGGTLKFPNKSQDDALKGSDEGLIEITTSGEGNLDITSETNKQITYSDMNTRLYPSFIPTNTDVTYTLTDNLKIQSIRYCSYDTKINCADLSVGEVVFQKRREALPPYLLDCCGCGKDDCTKTTECTNKTNDPDSCDSTSYLIYAWGVKNIDEKIISDENTGSRVGDDINLNQLTYSTAQKDKDDKYRLDVTLMPKVSNMVASVRAKSDDWKYSPYFKLDHDDKNYCSAFSYEYESRSINQSFYVVLSYNLKIDYVKFSGAVAYPDSVTFAPPIGEYSPATLHYSAQKWGLYVNDKLYINEEEVSANKEYTRSAVTYPTQTVITLDNAYITQAWYETVEFERGGKIIYPTETTINRIELKLIGNGSFTFDNGVNDVIKGGVILCNSTVEERDEQTSKEEPVIISLEASDLTGDPFEYSVTRRLIVSELTCHVSKEMINDRLSEFKFTKNWDIIHTKDDSVAITTRDNLSEAATAAADDLSYPIDKSTTIETGGLCQFPLTNEMQIDITTIGEGSLSFIRGVIGRVQVANSQESAIFTDEVKKKGDPIVVRCSADGNTITLFRTNLDDVSFAYEITNGMSIKDIRYRSYITIDSELVKPQISDVLWNKKSITKNDDDSSYYELGGLLTFPTKGKIAIKTEGTGILTLKSGIVIQEDAQSEDEQQEDISQQSSDSGKSYPCSDGSVVVIEKEDLTDDNSIEYTVTNGLTVAKTTLTYLLSAKTDSNEVKYTKNCLVTVINDDEKNVSTISEDGGSLEYPKNGEIAIVTRGAGTLQLIEGANEEKTYADEDENPRPPYIFTPISSSGITYILKKGLTIDSIHYSYDTVSDEITVSPLEKPGIAAIMDDDTSDKTMNCNTAKTIADPIVTALSTEVNGLVTLSDSSKHEQRLIDLNNEEMNLSQQLNGYEASEEGSKENKGLKTVNEELQEEYKTPSNENNELIKDKTELARQKTVLFTDIEELEKQIEQQNKIIEGKEKKTKTLDEQNLSDRNYTDDIKRKLIQLELLFGGDLASIDLYAEFDKLIHALTINGKEAISVKVESADITENIFTCDLSAHIKSEFRS